MDCEVVSYKAEVMMEFQRRLELCLNLIGSCAQNHAMRNCPVDTGRLRNSITHKVIESSVYIGTNVEYAKWVEVKSAKHETGQAHYLRDAVAMHGREFEKIAKTVFTT